MQGVEVRRVEAAMTYPLRQRVLRPHQPLSEMPYPGDDDPDAGHFAAFDDHGRVIGVGSVRPDRAPWSAGDGTAQDWRLRGMATAEGQRGRGVGAAVLDAVMTYVIEHGGILLWCNARLTAVEFYRRAGLTTCGEAWDEPHIGPHIVMYRSVLSGDP
jgi:GNAT superfamily N-acetyltransferase